MLVVLPVSVLISRICSVKEASAVCSEDWELLGPPGGFFPPLGVPVGYATLKAVLHASVNLSTVLSSSCKLVMLSDGSMGKIFVRTFLYLCQSARLGLAKLTGKGESRDNTVSMNRWYEKECSSKTAQFLTAPTSESDTKVSSMIVWQVLVIA